MPATTNGHGRLRNERHAPNGPGDSGPDQPRQKQVKTSDDEGSLSSVKSCDIEEGGDDGHSDGAEADEEDENGRDGDVIAPSDSAIHRDGNRAGHIKGKSTTGGKSSKSSSGFARQKGLVIKNSTSVKDGDHSQVDEDSFDDEDYNGVDLISDSEDGGSSAEQLEERLIIDSEEEIPFGFSSDDDGGYDLDGGLFLSDVPYFDEQYGRNDPAVLANEIEIFNSASFFEDNTPPLPTRTGKRRVRFADPVTPSRKSTGNVASESDEDMGPNPFRSADEMASTLWQMKQCVGKRRPINDDERSRWGFDQSEKPAFGSHELNDDRSEGSDGSSSGYESVFCD